MKRNCSVLFALALLAAPAAQAQFTYTTNADNTLTITGYYSATGGPVTIPTTNDNGLSVTGIGAAAFNGSSLTSVTIPSSITNIGYAPFQNCLSLTTITVDTNNAFYSSMNGVLFDIGQTTLIQFPAAEGGSYTIPRSVTSIGMEAFVQCYNLTGVTIGDGVTNIGENAFAGCNLTSVTIPGSVSSIAENTFFECLYLRNVTIANGVASIGDEAFGNCTPGLTSITMPGSVTNLQPYAFAGCTTLASIYFTGNAPSADFTAFLQDSRAKVYYLPGMTGWSNSFADLPATMLQAYTYVINAGAVTITGFSQPGSAFIPNVSIPDTINGLPVTSITNDAFELDEGLTSITLPATITNIGQAAFADCTNLISVTISNGVKSIGANVFQSCLSLSNLIIPASVTSIGAFAFAGCVSLSSLTIPTGVTSIGPLAFEACLSLSSITIPASVTNIGVGPFYACTNLTAITVDPNNAFYSSVNGVLFDKRQGILVAYPPGLGGSYTVPCSVTNLAQFAFAHCFSLTNLYFKVNAPSIGSSVLLGDTNTMVYYLPGTLGWSSPFAGVPAVLWNPVIQTGDGSFGVSSGQFGFNIAGTANIPIAVEACTNLACPVWTPLQSLALTNGLVYFSEPAQGNGGGRFYRISSP